MFITEMFYTYVDKLPRQCLYSYVKGCLLSLVDWVNREFEPECGWGRSFTSCLGFGLEKYQ